MKVVVNRCYGGYGLSEQAVLRYAELKGIKLYVEKGWYETTIYWLVPEKERTGIIYEHEFYNRTLEERHASNMRYAELTLCPRDIDRNDTALIQAVEELGEEANGEYAELEVVEIPDDVQWTIEEYDGFESIHEVHRVW